MTRTSALAKSHASTTVPRSFSRAITRTLALSLGAWLVAGSALAQSVSGEVLKIDKAQQKITLRHGELKNLDMPAMTMVFRVQDASWLDTYKVGDRVLFDADKVGGNFTVVKMVGAK